MLSSSTSPQCLVLACLLGLLGCPSTSPTEASPPAKEEPAPSELAAHPKTPEPDPNTPRPDGAACSTHDECQSGICEGHGCEPEQGRCVAKERMCTRDLRAYCSCDGETFRSSGSCPGQRYRHPGTCDAPAPDGDPPPPGAH